MTVVLLVPLVYLVLTLGRVQAAGYAAESASREAGRIMAITEDVDEAVRRATLAVEYAFADHGIAVDGSRVLRVHCAADPCRTPGALIDVEVTAAVSLPLAPRSGEGALPLEVPVSSSYAARVPAFGESG